MSANLSRASNKEKVQGKKAKERTSFKLIFLLILLILCFLALFICLGIGTLKFSFSEIAKGLFVEDDSMERIIIFKTRLPRLLCGAFVGICLALAGAILQSVMRNDLASPTTIGVTSGASFVGYLTLVVFPQYISLLPIGTILGSFLTTLLIYGLAYQKGVSPVKIILSGVAVSAVFSAFNDIIKTFYSEQISNVVGFQVGGLNGVGWNDFYRVLPYALAGIIACFFLPKKMNILMLGDESANALGLRTDLFRFALICISSLLAGSAISVAGLISFVGLIVPHTARLILGSDNRFLLPGSALLGALLVMVCDTIGRVILSSGEVPLSIILSCLGAPFFLILLRRRKKD